MVFRWACKRVTWERNTTIRLGIGSSESGEDTKEDGGEEPESENEIHIALKLKVWGK